MGTTEINVTSEEATLSLRINNDYYIVIVITDFQLISLTFKHYLVSDAIHVLIVSPTATGGMRLIN